MGPALRAAALALATFLCLASAPIEPCGEVCEMHCTSYTREGTRSSYIDPEDARYAAAVAACFADDFACDELCYRTLDAPCGPASFHTCAITTQPGGWLLVETEYTLHCTRCWTECMGFACPPDAPPEPDARPEPDAPPIEADAAAEADAPDADAPDAGSPDAAPAIDADVDAA